jgi:hypothetical protein
MLSAATAPAGCSHTDCGGCRSPSLGRHPPPPTATGIAWDAVTYRIVQWATGAVGKTCLRAVLDHPDMTLAGLYVYSSRKAGQDAGTIARFPETGIIATRDIGEILALDADVVIHTARLQVPYTQHDDDICALLRSGKNVITTAGHHYPAAHGPARLAMFDEAARAGGATLYGTGMNPGYVLERLVLGLTGVCTDVRRIEVVELLDASTMPDPDFVFTVMGMGSDPAALDLCSGPLAALYGQLYSEAIAFTCDRMAVAVDEIVPDHRVVAAERDLEISAGHIAAGTVAATEWRWHAISDGDRFLTLSVIWTMDPELADYAGRHHWTVDVEGRPDLHLSLDMSDPPGTGLRTKAGQYVTAGAVINAIPAVVAAPPGVFAPPVFAPFMKPSIPFMRPEPPSIRPDYHAKPMPYQGIGCTRSLHCRVVHRPERRLASGVPAGQPEGHGR